MSHLDPPEIAPAEEAALDEEAAVDEEAALVVPKAYTLLPFLGAIAVVVTFLIVVVVLTRL